MRKRTDSELIKHIIQNCDTSGGPDACWPWQRGRGPDGYGHISRNGRLTTTHRALYLAITGRDPATVPVVRHTCDNPPCCNERHLIGGTHAENMADTITRGRRAKKYKPHSRIRKLTDEQVRAIRQDWRKLHIIAHENGVSESVVSNIRLWKSKQMVDPQLQNVVLSIITNPETQRRAKRAGKVILIPGKLRPKRTPDLF